jgi:hypothetical protein
MLRIPSDLRSATLPIESIKSCAIAGSEQATAMSSTYGHRRTKDDLPVDGTSVDSVVYGIEVVEDLVDVLSHIAPASECPEHW